MKTTNGESWGVAGGTFNHPQSAHVWRTLTSISKYIHPILFWLIFEKNPQTIHDFYDTVSNEWRVKIRPVPNKTSMKHTLTWYKKKKNQNENKTNSMFYESRVVLSTAASVEHNLSKSLYHSSTIRIKWTVYLIKSECNLS